MAEALPESATSAVYLHLAASRIKELRHLDWELGGCKSGKGGRCYQKLPRHMQRRALSSNPKRLPRRLRHRHLAEGEPPRPTKRPTSKHRPRPRARASRPAPDDQLAPASLPECGDRCAAETAPAAGRPSGRSRAEDYVRRQGAPGNAWLETHVWHAKRFHMERRWGYALPLRPTQKMYRPILRAVGQRCVVQDVSFLCCVEVRGAGVLRALEACTAQCARPRLQSVRAGDAWHSFTLYRPARCPLGAVCEVELQRLPRLRALHDSEGPEDGEESRVWMWVHPASHGDLLDLLCEVFPLHHVARKERSTETAPEENKENWDVMDVDCAFPDSEGGKKTNLVEESSIPISTGADCSVGDQTSNLRSKVKQKHHLLQERLASASLPDYISNDKKISVFCLKDTLNRFRLRGPEAYDILKSILVPSSIIPESHDDASKSETSELPVGKSSDSSVLHSNSISCENANPAMKSKVIPATSADGKYANSGNGLSCAEDESNSSRWWESYHAAPERQAGQRTNALCWAEPPSLQDNVVLPLVVRDPRVLLPSKRAKIDQSRDRTARRPLSVRDVCPDSALYDPALRLLVLQQRRPDHLVNGDRQQSGVPGAVLPLTSEEARLPVVLLLRRLRQSAGAAPSHDSLGVAYDVIVPGGWGSNFWMALVYAGAVAVGVDSEVHFMREEHTPPPPYLLPDLPAGRQYEQLKAQELRQEHFNLPPDKRPNFIKLGVQFPFSFPWSKLIASLSNQPSFRSALEKEIGTGFSNEVLQQLGLPQSKSEDADSNFITEGSCVLRNTRYLKALDVLSCRSGSRRRIFRGLDKAPKDTQNNHEGVSSSAPGYAPPLEEGLLDPPLKENFIALHETINLMQRTCQSHLVRVQVTLIGKGSIEPLALICRPSASDLQRLKEVLTNEQRPSLDVCAGAVEPSKPDLNEEKRKLLKKEHEKDQTKLHRLRKAARRRVRREHEDGSGSLDDAITEALQRLDCQQQALMSRKESYASTSESLWLLSPEAPLQQCSRLIVGCVTDASFSRLRGCGVGQGFVVVGTLLPTCKQRLDRWQHFSPLPRDEEDGEGQSPRKKLKLDDGSSVANDACVGAGEEDKASAEGPHVDGESFDADLPFIQDRGIAVLIRNKNSLQYRFGLLTVCCQQPPS